jgi:hypothetical protein
VRESVKVTPFEASVATGLLVAGATWLGAWINSSTHAKRERKARADERRQVFEQETLVRLQDALDDLYRIVEETGLERFPPNRDDVQYIDVPPEPLEYRRAEAAASTLAVRVLDDDLRALAEKVVEHADEVMKAGSRVTFWDRSQVLKEQSTLAHQQIGERLRRLYSPDESNQP